MLKKPWIENAPTPPYGDVPKLATKGTVPSDSFSKAI